MDNSTSTIADPLSLSLRAWPSKDATTESLTYLISRIIEQRGSFRTITEQNLEEEIRNIKENKAQSGQEDVESSDDEIQTATSKTEGVKVARVEILKLMAQAQMESAYALDFVSLLLSKHAPKQAEITISPFLRRSVPMGSLGVEMVQLPQVSDTKNLDNKRVSTGWKLQSLNATADSLLQSATRLTKEMEEETRYWEQVLAIKDQGWPICRLPREKHTLGVRYGFSEAAPEFRDKGLAALRRNENGDIDLDLGLRASSSRVLRIQVKENGKIVSSSPTGKFLQSEDELIENSILQARNDVFDEELYHELYREARNLTNKAVRCVGDKITFPLAGGKEVIVELVPITDVTLKAREHSMTDVSIAEFLVNASRILLSHSHRQTLNRRSQLQLPLTEKRPPRPLYSILRPILAHLQHLSASKETQSFLTDLKVLFTRANVPSIINDSSSTTELLQIMSPAPRPHQTFVDAFINSISAPLHSVISLELPSSSSHIAIHTRTHLMGTEYKIVTTASTPTSFLSTVPQETHFTSTNEMKNYLTHLLTLEMIAFIEVTSSNGGWRVTSPHTGQLSIDGGVSSPPYNMSVSLQPNEISLHYHGVVNERESEGSYIWNLGDSHDEPPMDLIEISRRIAAGLIN